MEHFTHERCCVQILSWPLKTIRQFHRPPVSTHSGPSYNFTSSYYTGAQRNSASLATQPREDLASQLGGKRRCAPVVKGGQTGGYFVDKSNLNGSAYRKDPVQQFLVVINTIARIVASEQ